ncbi:F-box/kelch-repeat protein SKIP30 [Camellia lanceoleosa]|uniref:F-box/kelch-repeat protein SKIP30 n=1 Tax=Camellia lanceoleosa TaxID=1840588 RepID=A0ACC0FRK5_9ERIC|nr:F-box/kelch-repeat protein SKIP30 [Camellia lanceoleosa]
MSGLIEGLPDAVALRCLARVPLYLHSKLELVSRSWRSAIRSPELFKARKEVNSSEDFLCVCAFDPENLWQLYDPLRDLWITLPVLPSKIRHLANFGVVSTAGKLFVLGGGSDAVDPLTATKMGALLPTSKIVVAGGFTSCQKSISKAEIYDPEKDVWVSIPDLHHTHNTACSGVVIEGKVHVLHKGLSTVQVLDGVKLGWTVRDYGWLQGPMAVIRGALYVMSHGIIFKQEIEASKVVVSASEFRRRIGLAMIGLGDDIYVIGGVVIGPERWNSDIKKLSVVNVLTIGSERPIWRRVAPMTRNKERFGIHQGGRKEMEETTMEGGGDHNREMEVAPALIGVHPTHHSVAVAVGSDLRVFDLQ